MIRGYRLKKLIGPTAGFRNALGILTAGCASFIIGAALSFKLIVLPFLEWLAESANELLSHLVSQGKLEYATHILGGAFLFLGFYLIFSGVRLAVRHLVQTLSPGIKQGMVGIYLRRQQLAQGPHIVALGGGTGLSTLLRGLKQHSSNITAIVTVTDDGGSSGRLSQETGMIPPGDIRNCLVALAEAEKSMTDLFQYRFKLEQGSLSGHSMGNLLIAGLVDQAQGDFEKAIEIASDVLAIRGRVVPSTLSHVRLKATMEDGSEIFGETKIVDAREKIRRIYLDPQNADPYQAAIDAILDADLICIGPGSVYTSVIPNLLVPGILSAIRQSDGVKAYICNVMTQPGESDSFTASEHVMAIQSNVDGKFCDYVLVNSGVPNEELIGKYRTSNQFLVEADIDRIRAMGFKVATGDFMSQSELVRHDPLRLATRLMRLIGE